MASSHDILMHLVEETNAAKAHFQTWWTLRNLALPEFYETMNDSEHRQFFHASNSGHYKLIFIALGKVFDNDTRAAGLTGLKIALRDEGNGLLADALEAKLAPIKGLVINILGIRNRTIAHNEQSLSRKKVYELNGMSADKIREIIDVTSDAINAVVSATRFPFRVMVGDSYERATISMLKRLRDTKA